MLALLNYVQSLLGKRNLIAFIVLAALSATALELTSLARNAFETFIQKQAATFAEQKAKGEADVATATAREKEAQAQLAAEIAANAKFRQLAEAQLAGAGAREKEFQAQLAAEVAANAKFRQAAEAQLAQASAREKEAMAKTAAATANNSEELQSALAAKTRAEAVKIASEAAIDARIARAVAAQPDRNPTVVAFEEKIKIVDELSGGTGNPARDGLVTRPYQAPAAPPTDRGFRAALTDAAWELTPPLLRGEKPRNAPQTSPQADAHDKQIKEDCKRRLAGFVTMKDHAAIAVTPNGGCSWTAGQPTKQAAAAMVMNQCAKANVRTCSIALAR